MISVDTRDFMQQMQSSFARKARKLDAKVAQASFKAAALVDREFKIEYNSGNASGNLYRVSETGPLHRASVNLDKAEYPANMFGDLGRATTAEPLADGSAIVASRVKHARFLHEGTARMKPRKSIIDKAYELRPEVREIYKKAGQEGLG